MTSTAVSLVGCTGRGATEPPVNPPRSMSFEDAVDRMTGLRCDGPVSVEIVDPVAIGFIRGYLRGSEPVQAPNAEYSQRGTVTMRVGDSWETKSYEMICHSWAFARSPGFVKWEGNWFEVPAEFLGILAAVDSHSPDPVDFSIPEDDEVFLASHGWTPFFLINTMQVDLPEELVHRPGYFPDVLYWAWNNDVSKDTGLDLSSYLGTTVETRIYKTVEMLPEGVGSNRHQTRAILVKSGGKVIGAWLDVGTSSCLGYSLDGRSREQVTGFGFDDWVTPFIDASNPKEQELAQLSPEEIIESYYSAINRKDFQTAHACESRKTLVGYLTYNMDRRSLHSDGFGEEKGQGLGNFISVEVLSITRQESFERPEAGYGDMRCYSVGVNQERIVVAGSAGGYFISMKEETPETGWRLYGIGTGP